MFKYNANAANIVTCEQSDHCHSEGATVTEESPVNLLAGSHGILPRRIGGSG